MIHVMAAMRVLPAKVRCPESRVYDESDDVTYLPVRRECAMSALVSDAPDAGKDETLKPPVYQPDTVQRKL